MFYESCDLRVLFIFIQIYCDRMLFYNRKVVPYVKIFIQNIDYMYVHIYFLLTVKIMSNIKNKRTTYFEF